MAAPAAPTVPAGPPDPVVIFDQVPTNLPELLPYLLLGLVLLAVAGWVLLGNRSRPGMAAKAQVQAHLGPPALHRAAAQLRPSLTRSSRSKGNS